MKWFTFLMIALSCASAMAANFQIGDLIVSKENKLFVGIIQSLGNKENPNSIQVGFPANRPVISDWMKKTSILPLLSKYKGIKIGDTIAVKDFYAHRNLGNVQGVIIDNGTAKILYGTSEDLTILGLSPFNLTYKPVSEIFEIKVGGMAELDRGYSGNPETVKVLSILNSNGSGLIKVQSLEDSKRIWWNYFNSYDTRGITH